MTIHPYDLIFAGLVSDIAGALILAKGFMLKNPMAAFYESLMLLTGNEHLLKSALLQRAEACVGGIFLVIGFGLQIGGNLCGGVAATELGWVNSLPRTLVLTIATAVPVAIALMWARWRAKVTFYRIFFRSYTGEPIIVSHDDPTYLARHAVLLDLPRRRHESDPSLLARVQARHAKLGAKHAGKVGEAFRAE